jgi:mRNA interferase MazF
MKRGVLVTISLSDDYGKPQPALVVQLDEVAILPFVTVLQLTREIHNECLVRITVQPSADNGLHKPSQVMIDRAVTVPRTKVGPVDQLDNAGMLGVRRTLTSFLGPNGLMA